jgi:hypothetical protein
MKTNNLRQQEISKENSLQKQTKKSAQDDTGNIFTWLWGKASSLFSSLEQQISTFYNGKKNFFFIYFFFFLISNFFFFLVVHQFETGTIEYGNNFTLETFSYGPKDLPLDDYFSCSNCSASADLVIDLNIEIQNYELRVLDLIASGEFSAQIGLEFQLNDPYSNSYST